MAFGLLGLAMRRYGYSRPALLLGFVLGGLFESYSLLSIKIYGPLFILRPIPLTILIIIIILLNYSHLKKFTSGIRQRLIKA